MSLKTELHQRIMRDMIEKSRGTSPAIVLILDSYTSKIVSSSCRMYDLMEAGVVVIEKLSLNRQRLDLPAIYFIHPTNDSIDRVIADFKDAKKPQYEHVHLFFTQRVKKDYMQKLGACNPLVKRIKNFVELNVDFIALESRVFTLNRLRTIPLLYFPPNTQVLSDELTAISKQLVSVFLTLKEFPYVRYSSAARNGICKGLAQFFEDDMKKVIGQLPNWKASETRERGTLLIVDRSLDPAAPLMHEYTYQAMVCDLLKVQGELYHRKAPKSSSSSSSTSSKDEKTDEKNPLVLSEDDPLWLDLRHKHIGEVMHDITEKFREFRGKNKMAQMQTEENATVKQMLQAMKDMPEYKQMMQKLHKHMSLAEDCMRRFDKKKLKELGELEQDMATGLGEDGKAVVVKNLKTSLVKMCQDPQIGVLEKLRLMMIFIISQGGVQDAIRKELMKPIHIDLQKAIRNLEKLGVDLSVMQGNKPKQSKQRLAEFAKRTKTIPLALMRYVPYLQSVLEQLIQYELDEEKFPYTAPPPAGSTGKSSAGGKTGKSARKAKAGDWKKGDGKDENKAASFDDDDRPLFVVFVLGGITFSELRSAYEIAEQQNVKLIVGSTNPLIASEYIRELADISNSHFRHALKQPPADGSQQVIDSDLEGDDNAEDGDEDGDEAIGSEKVALRIADSD